MCCSMPHEMQFIADELFIGNKLAAGDVVTSDGSRIDLRNIRSPIIVFCSKADNITPPPQALDWILDLYDSVDDIRAHGQTIVYAVHESIGHLGIFVSGSVAKKEHDEFASNIDLIDALPPGLYEAVMTPKNSDDTAADLISGDYLVRFEARTLDDIRALGGNDDDDDRKFATAARVSEINLGLYRTLCSALGPAVGERRCRGMDAASASLAPAVRDVLASQSLHAPAAVASRVRARRTGSRLQKTTRSGRHRSGSRNGLKSRWTPIATCGTTCRRRSFTRSTGHRSCRPPLASRRPTRACAAGPARMRHISPLVARRIDELRRTTSAKGGPREAVIRALLYIRMPEGVVDERGFNLLRRMREEAGRGLTLGEFKQLLREQFFMLLLDERRAVEAIPDMLAQDPRSRQAHGGEPAPADRCGWAAQRRSKVSLGRDRRSYSKKVRSRDRRSSPRRRNLIWLVSGTCGRMPPGVRSTDPKVSR